MIDTSNLKNYDISWSDELYYNNITNVELVNFNSVFHTKNDIKYSKNSKYYVNSFYSYIYTNIYSFLSWFKDWYNNMHEKNSSINNYDKFIRYLIYYSINSPTFIIYNNVTLVTNSTFNTSKKYVFIKNSSGGMFSDAFKIGGKLVVLNFKSISVSIDVKHTAIFYFNSSYAAGFPLDINYYLYEFISPSTVIPTNYLCEKFLLYTDVVNIPSTENISNINAEFNNVEKLIATTFDPFDSILNLNYAISINIIFILFMSHLLTKITYTTINVFSQWYNVYLKWKIIELIFLFFHYNNEITSYSDQQLFNGLSGYSKIINKLYCYMYFDANVWMNSTSILNYIKKTFINYYNSYYNDIILFLTNKTIYFFQNKSIVTIVLNIELLNSFIVNYNFYLIIYYYLCYHKLNLLNTNNIDPVFDSENYNFFVLYNYPNVIVPDVNYSNNMLIYFNLLIDITNILNNNSIIINNNTIDLTIINSNSKENMRIKTSNFN